jgi:hypothetical protein
MTLLLFAPAAILIYILTLYIAGLRAVRDWNSPHFACSMAAAKKFVYFIQTHGSGAPRTQGVRVVEITKEQLMEMLKDQQP